MNKPDLILMDVQMPEMNGYEATSNIRQLEPAITAPIIALTAGNVKSEKEKCLAAGMDDFLLKPIVESTLALAFEKWLHFYDLNQAAHLHFDKTQVLATVGEDDDLVKQVLHLTRNELIDSEHALEQAFMMEDLMSLNSIGHKLYSTAITSGLKILSIAANELANLDDFDRERVGNLREKINNEIRTCLKLIS
jgi:response regulator RpfG family c-di-GMP phosphodiesterase